MNKIIMEGKVNKSTFIYLTFKGIKYKSIQNLTRNYFIAIDGETYKIDIKEGNIYIKNINSLMEKYIYG